MAFGMAIPAIAAPFTVSSPVAARQYRIRLAAEFKDTPGKDTLILPKLELTVPVAPGLSVAVKGHVRTIDEDGAHSQTGFGDIELKAKWNFLKVDERRIAIAIEPVLSLPSGDYGRGLGDSHIGITLPLILGYEAGAWDLGGEVGYEHVFGSTDHKGYTGILAMRHFTPSLRLGAEFILETSEIDFGLDTRANVGFKLKIGKNSELQGLVGRTLHTTDDQTENEFKMAYEIRW